jgi:DNA-binding NtrC family response regulator
MSLNSQSYGATVQIEPGYGLVPGISNDAQILIICDQNSLTERLKVMFRQIGLNSETATCVTDGCNLAKSGRFQVIVTVPVLHDGSWRRLIDMAKHYDLAHEVVLLADDFDLRQWGDALNEGAFDVINILYELPNAPNVVVAAFWAVYLKGGGQLPQCLLKLEGSKNAA